MVIGCDLDGVLLSFLPSYALLLAEVAGVDKLPDGWRNDIDCGWATCWSWEPLYGYSQATIDRVWKDHILASPTFWFKLKPIVGAKETVRHMNQMVKDGKVDAVYFITHRMGFKAKEQTEKSLYELGADFPTVLLSGDKVPLLRNLGVDVFIDDRYETVVDAGRFALNERRGMKVYLKSAAYNQGVYPSSVKRVGSVKEALVDAGLW